MPPARNGGVGIKVHIFDRQIMTHATRTASLRASIRLDIIEAKRLEAEVLDGTALEYEAREGFDPGYVAGLAVQYRLNSKRLLDKLHSLIRAYKNKKS